MTVDQITGKIFVVDETPNTPGYSSLLRFPPNADGNIAPFARSTDSLDAAYQIASDSSGQNVIEAHAPPDGHAYQVGLETFAKQFANNALINPIYKVYGLGSHGVADDPTTKTYLETSSYGIYRLQEPTVGSGPIGQGPTPAPITLNPAPVSIITSDTCGSQIAVAPGPTPNTYVTHSVSIGYCSADAVYVYSNNASGNAIPLRTLSGSATGLNAPLGIYEGK